ncbi:hypothetical protein GOV03_03740 [Candidatus Woesearchaeota archaeon]|nr:hypothetical protein [Candidatus Woesearchaeota archaeon]
MTTCYVCGKKGNLKHLDRDICKKCFLRNVERRVKKHLGRRMFKKDDKILVIGELEKVLLENAVKGMPLKIVSRKKLPKLIQGFDYIVVGRTMDEVGGEFLGGLMKGKLILGGMKKKFFNILEVLTDEEAEQYAKLKDIKFKVLGEKGFLDTLGLKELKYNLYKNIKELRKL